MIGVWTADLRRWWRGWERERDSFDNLRAAVVTFLLQSGYGRRAREVGAALLRHPAYPRLSAAIEVLGEHGIPVRALRCAPDGLETLQPPCLAIRRTAAGMVRLDVFSRVYGRRVTSYDTESGWREVPRVEYATQSTGVVITHVGERQTPLGAGFFAPARVAGSPAHRPLLFLTLATLLIASLTATVEPSTFLGLATLGFLLCSLLVAAGLDPHAGRALCPQGAGAGCGAVMGSPLGKGVAGLTLADLGLTVFLGSVAALWLAASRGQTAAVAALLGGLALAAVPITLFLIFYQAKTLRTWCPLCLGVHAVLWAQALSFDRADLTHLEGGAWVCTALGFGLAALAVAAILPGARAAERLDRLEPSFARLRRRPSVVRALLAESPRLELPAPENGALLGRADAVWRLDLFLTSGCRRCEENLRSARALLAAHPQTLAVVLHPVEKTVEWLERHQIQGVAAMFVNGRQAPEYLAPADLQQLLKTKDAVDLQARCSSGLF